MNIIFPPKPQVLPVKPGNIRNPAKVRLNNGTPVYIIESGTEDVMRIDFTFDAGEAQEYLPLLASTTNMMLTEGSRKYSSRELNKILDFHGAFYNLYTEKDRAGLIIFFITRHIEKILELTGEIIFRPLFPGAELKALMKKRLRWYLVNREKVNNLAMEHFFKSIFGNHHPYGRQIVPEDFDNMNPPLLKDFHAANYTPEKLAIIISGKIHGRTLDLLNRHFGENFASDVYIEESHNVLKASENRRIYIKKPGAVQTSVRIGCPTINKCHPDYPGLKILNVILGGYFKSRLMKNIREDKGLTYGIHSMVSSLILSGFNIISTEVSKKSTQKAIDEIYSEIKRLQSKPVEKEELTTVRNYMLGEMVRMFDGPFALAESFRSAWEFGLDTSYYDTLIKKIRTITPDEITTLAGTYYNIEKLHEITAG
jgi:zinc protease